VRTVIVLGCESEAVVKVIRPRALGWRPRPGRHDPPTVAAPAAGPASPRDRQSAGLRKLAGRSEPWLRAGEWSVIVDLDVAQRTIVGPRWTLRAASLRDPRRSGSPHAPQGARQRCRRAHAVPAYGRLSGLRARVRLPHMRRSRTRRRRWRRLARCSIQWVGMALAVAGAVAAIAVVANWRVGLVAAVAAAAIALTRMRFSAMAALGVLAVVLAVVVSGRTAGVDTRADKSPAPRR
jgi:hypothetical protein